MVIFWLSESLVDNDFLRLEVTKLWRADLWALECVVFEQSFLYAAIGKLHPTSTVLNAMAPLALVTATVFPVHFTVTMTLIILVASSVEVAGLPCKQTDARFLIILIRALIHIAVLGIKFLFPFSFPVLETVFELSDVNTAVFPFVLTLPLRFTVHVNAGEDIAVGKEIRTLSVLKAI